MVPYLAPQIFNGQRANKKSDVYSVGVLLWEISSGKIPIDSCNPSNQIAIIYKIIDGIREIPIPGTPIDYVSIYTSMNLAISCFILL